MPGQHLAAGRAHGDDQPHDPRQLRTELLAHSWPGAEGGPREDPTRGFTSFAATEQGSNRRLRAESFADHYSQARQFYLSQTQVEQRHIVSAFVFELSKCDRADIRSRMVSGLRTVLADAFAHYKFIGYTAPAAALFEAIGIGDKTDGGFVRLDQDGSVSGFFESCRQLRFWAREDGFG